MKRSSFITRMAVGAMVVSAGMASTTFLMGQNPVTPTTGPGATTAPTVLASVNGQDIDSEKFESLLMAVAGMRLLEQVVDLIVVEQACRQAGIPVDGEEFNKKNVQAELDRALANLGAQGVPEAARGQALAQILQRQGVSNPEFEMGLRRAACLRALSKGKIVPTDTDIQKLYDLEYGERIKGRLFSGLTASQGDDVYKMLKDKIDPTVVAQKMGLPLQNAVIAKSNDQPEIATLKTLAFSLKEGESTAAIIQKEGGYIVFFLDKKEPAQTSVKLDAALKEKLRERIIEQGEIQWGQQHLQRLRSMANINIKDPILSQQYANLMARIRAAQTQAATAPATAPAPK